MDSQPTPRRQQIIDAYVRYGTIRLAGEALGISGSRVHQVIRDHAPHLMHPHGTPSLYRQGGPYAR
jgi:hypothetical protein